MELCSMFCAILDGSGVWRRMDTCICMAESLCCSPETIITLLISYNPIQNKKFKVLKNKISRDKGKILKVPKVLNYLFPVATISSFSKSVNVFLFWK